ncbi:interferon-induced very large GTPase 1-like [Corticium candelabrum]|uniref:interferon-induced very large GTPase 1-like n=1 Tax=Corticium candelabrum TaxID=121492 RepID=UPI002E25B9C0|nr:interferon-induced very large GTPase 1-like [Corticium candelabrum]
MQLLRGNPLQMTASKFIQDIMKQLGVELKNRSDLLVVSVIGAQSSAKSTLLNYLFGCGFATRVGRCTKGLYASFVRISDGRYLLVLDSEGLLSLEGSGHVFDGQITVMAMACSDAVIVNHKGEISSQMKELLEVCLYAMDYLQVADIRTEMMFVLRDQRDRNTKVQSDSLTLMRKMLREAMGSGQKNLDDLVSLKHDAIFLLPSAFSEVKREERTVESPSAVFSEEAFALRQRILQSTLGDRSTLDSPDDSEVLINWYRHACIVWDTLTKYGYTLLHYKALHELRLHKEINEIVTSLVKQAENKFNEQARAVVKKHTERLQTVKDETSVLMYDKECQSELTSLKRATHEELVHYFEQRTQAKKYNEDLKKEFRCKLATPLSSAYDFHTYSWLRQLHLAKHRLNTEAFDRSFYVQLDRELTRTGYQSSLSVSDAAKIFDNLWKQYESKYRKRLLETRKTDVDVEAEVLKIFRHVWERHQHNKILAIVSSAFRLTTLSKSTDFVNSSDNIWVKKYLKTKSTVIQKAWDMFLPTSDKNLIGSNSVVVHEMKTRVQNLQDRFVKKIVSQDGKCNTDIVTDIVLLACNEVKQVESVLFTYHERLKLQRAPFTNDLIVHLQQVAYQVVCSAEEKRILEQEDELERMREKKRETFIATASNEADDLERAARFADEYNEQLKVWVKSKVHEFASEVRDQVLQQMQDPEKAAERAYHSSFKRGNYDEVLEYCIDVNAYLKKLFIQMFANRKQIAIHTNEHKLTESVSEMYKMVEDTAVRWQQSCQTTAGHLNDFKDYLETRAEDLSETASVRNLLMAALVRFPQMTNFPIARVEVFCTRCKSSMRKLLTKVLENLQEIVANSMSDECEQVWTKIKGCRAKCPLCGSKCSLVNDHSDHNCARHIFPAFHGTRVRNWKHPVFDMCLSTDAADMMWGRGDDPMLPSLSEFLDYYDDCRPWKKSIVPDPTLVHEPEEQIQAWAVCRKPLVKYWHFVDKTPEDWLNYESNKPLKKDECDKAKARLEEYQDI